METAPATVLDACERCNLPSKTKMFNYYDLEQYLHIKLPSSIGCNHKIYSVNELCDVICFDISPHCIRTGSGFGWLDIPVTAVNLNAGLHTYRIYMIDTCTDQTFSLYFAYSIQNDNPYKPYVYMHPEVFTNIGELTCEETYNCRV